MSTGESKFSAKDAEAKITIGNEQPLVTGLSKEELLKFSNDPFWIAVRKSLFVGLCFIWLLMLVTAVVVVIFTPKCDNASPPLWYESSPIYTIRVDQFADSNGDNIGDIAGIIGRLDYIQNDLSIRTIALEGLLDKKDLSSMQADFGSEADFTQLTSRIKVVIKIPLYEAKFEDVDNVLKKWLDLDAAGFILDEFNTNNNQLVRSLSYWRQIVDDASGQSALLAISPTNYEEPSNTFCNSTNMMLNYDMIKLGESYDGAELFKLLEDLLSERKSKACRSNFVLGSANVSPMLARFQSRFRAESMLIFSMLADATPIVYYGDEYGKKDTSGETKNRTLVLLPDPNTGKMQWEDMERAKSEPNYNLFKLFQNVAKLRLTEPSILQGTTALRQLGTNAVLAMCRLKIGNPGFVVVSNYQSSPATINLLNTVSSFIPAHGEVVLHSTNSAHKRKEQLSLQELTIEPDETIVLQFVAEKRASSH